jgi:hypothetical protein
LKPGHGAVNFIGSGQNNILSLTVDVSLGKGMLVR